VINIDDFKPTRLTVHINEALIYILQGWQHSHGNNGYANIPQCYMYVAYLV